jgi:hypothetical protein
MGVSFGKIFGKAYRYGLSGNRILPMFIIQAVMWLTLLLGIGPILSVVNISSSAALAGILAWGIGFFIVIIAVMFAQIFFQISYIHNAFNYWKGRDLKLSTSYKHAKGKYLKYWGAVLLVFMINMTVALFLSYIPIISDIVGLILGFLFLLYPAIVVLEEGKGIIDSIKGSFNLFMKNKWDVFVYWLILLAIVTGIFLLAMLPVLALSWPILAAIGSGASITAAIQSSMPMLITATLFVSLVFAYVSAFSTSSIVFLYMQIKKGKF